MGDRKGVGHMNRIPVRAIHWPADQLVLSMYLYRWEDEPFSLYLNSMKIGWSYIKFVEYGMKSKMRESPLQNGHLIIHDQETLPVREEWVQALEAREITEEWFAWKVKREAGKELPA
jgi:hypothetical protein